MTQSESTSSAEYLRYLELSRMLGMKTMLLIEGSTDDTIEVHLKRCTPGEEPLIREAYEIYKKWQHDDDSDITWHPV